MPTTLARALEPVLAVRAHHPSPEPWSPAHRESCALAQSQHQSFFCTSTQPCTLVDGVLTRPSITFYMGTYHESTSNYGAGRVKVVKPDGTT